MVALTLSMPLCRSQQADSYWVNQGLTSMREAYLGEFGVNLGGHVPFSSLNPGHYYFNPGSPPSSLRDLVEDNFLDLTALDNAIQAYNPGKSLPPPDAVLVQAYQTTPWWTSAYQLDVWEFRINQGYAQFVRRSDQPDDGGVVHVLYEHLPNHPLDFSSKGFQGSSPFLLATTPWDYNAQGLPNLRTTEQAVAAGDIYCMVTENLGADIWIALQRNQEADWVLRNRTGLFTPPILGQDGQGQPETLGDSFVEGGSFGAAVAQVLALLQPNVYSGCGWAFSLDYGYEFYGIGDWSRLQQHFECGTGGTRLHGAANRNFIGTLHLMIDILGLRFDTPGGNNWDMAAFSSLRRPTDLQVPAYGFVGASDRFVNFHWQDTPSRPALHQTAFFKDQAHEGPQATFGGENEYFQWSGTEWAVLKSNALGAGSPSALIPSATLVGDPYPDPYSHTLRHSCAGSTHQTFLTAIDLNPDTGNVDTLGQGVWTGLGDTLAIDDFDGDGNKEIVFGNLEGYVHVVEVLGLATTRFKDEWRSPRRGWGLWAMGRDGGRLTFGNQQGQIYDFRALAANTYEVKEIGTGLQSYLYDGTVRMLQRGNFSNTFPGKEMLILNHHKDWVVLDQYGSYVESVKREPKAIGPGAGPVVTRLPNGIDTDDEQELVVPAVDGHVWFINRNPVGSLEHQELIPFSASPSPRAWYLAEAIDADSDGTPEGLLLFGRDDAQPAGLQDRVALYDFTSTPPQFVDDEATAVPLRDDPAFAWLSPPAEGFPARFAVGGGNLIESFDLTGVNTLSPVGSATIPVDLDPGDTTVVRGGVLALETLTLPTEPITRHLVALTGNGRIWLLDDELAFMRTSLDVDPTIDPVSASPWPSNRTLAHEFAMDAEQTGAGAVALRAASFQQRFRTDSSGDPEYWIQGITLDAQDNVTFTPDYEVYPPVPSYAETAPNRAGGDAVAPLNRFLYYRPGTAAEALAECGVRYVDPLDGPRWFNNRSRDPGILSTSTLGGYLFEAMDPGGDDYKVLSGFVTTPDPPYYNSGITGDWGYPTVGPNRPGKATGSSPQLDTPVQSTNLVFYGTSMTTGRLFDPQEVPYVVTGTMGGHVYAMQIPPYDPDPLSEEVVVADFYESLDLGWNVIGLDAGDLHDDDTEEIVAGVLVDDGNFDDWLGANPAKNRAHVSILAPNASSGRLDVLETLDAADLAGAGQRIGAGVLGVKIDNVDGAGPQEIWCGDAAGHLYLFRYNGSSWVTAFKSDCLAAYMGAYNQIFPVKENADGTGETVKLLVVSSGYVHAFAVDAMQLYWGNQP